MADAERIQAYVRATARRLKTAIPVPPFTAFLHPHDPLVYLSFAIPDEPVGGELTVPLERLAAVFRQHDRTPRLEYVRGFAPELAPALEAAGFSLELRTPVMICDADAARDAPPVPGLRIEQLTLDSPLEHVQTSITVARRAFGLGNEEPAGEEEAARRRARLDRDIALLGFLDGEPAAVAQATAPLDGLSELGGIGTLTEFRSLGIGSALTAAATRAALEAGAETAFLTPGDEGAFRIYERAGYTVAETMLFYVLR